MVRWVLDLVGWEDTHRGAPEQLEGAREEARQARVGCAANPTLNGRPCVQVILEGRRLCGVTWRQALQLSCAQQCCEGGLLKA